MGIFDQDNTSVVIKQPSQLFWNNGKIDRITTPIMEDRLTADNRDWGTRQFNKLTESPIGQLYSKAEQIPVVNFVLPSTEGLTNFVDNRSSLWNKAAGALEAVPLLAGAGYKGFKVVNKLNSKLSSQSNALLKSLPNRQTMGYNNNVEALTALQKLSDEKGYGLRGVVHYANNQNKTDAIIKGIMNRHRTFARGVSAPDKETAVKYLSEIPGETGAGRYGLNAGEHALYTSNSLGTAEGYTYGKGYIGKIRLPVDYSSPNRIDWIEKNKELPKSVLKQEYDGTYISRNIGQDIYIRSAKKLNDAKYNFDYYKRERDRLYKKLEETGEQADYLREDYEKEFSNATNKMLPYIPLIKKYESLLQKVSKKYNLDNDVSNSGDYRAYNHYLFQGTPGQKIGEVIDIKQITPETWGQKSRAHEGEYSSGLSLAGFAPIMLTQRDSIFK